MSTAFPTRHVRGGTLVASLAVLAAGMSAPVARAQTAPMTSAPTATAPTATGPAATGPAASVPAASAPAAVPATEARSKFVDARITQLHQALGITAAQQPDFDALAQVMRDNAATIYAASSPAGGVNPAKMSAPDVMAGYARVAAAHAQAAQAIVSPFSTLYGTLSDAQKAKADKLFRAFVRRQHG